MFAEVTRDQADGVCVPCTNFPMIWAIEDFEALYGCVIYDTLATVMWKSMIMVDVAPAQVLGWGSLFQRPVPAARG
jgi:maleate isomerase